MQTIGERLEEARKKKGISIREAAEATKIRGDYLQKFESNHFDIGLTEIYTRGFLRNYAQFLKLPAERLLNDYAALGRGEVRQRPGNREVYGRMDVEVPKAEDIDERVQAPAPDADGPAEAPRPPRRGRTPRSLAPGPDPAVVFRWIKWGSVALLVLLALFVISTYRSGSTARPAGVAAAPVSPAPAIDRSFTLIALGDVQVTVSVADTGQELFRGLLQRGQSRVVSRPAALYVSANPGENLALEIAGKRYPFGLQGDARGKLPEPR